MSLGEDVFAFPASFAQQRLWFLDQIEPGTAVYSIPQALRLRGPLDVDALQRALQAIVDRHEALRTTFAAPEGEPMQVVAAALTFTLPVVDLSSHPEAEAEAMRRARAEAERPFDLAQGPLFRGELVRLGAQDHLLVLNVHHSICDGWSLAVLFRELSALYRGDTLPELPIQYADYALWQRELVTGPNLEAELAFWRERLGGELPVLELPADRARGAAQGIRGRQLRFHVSRELTDQLMTLGRSEGASLFMTLLAAFQVLLHRLSGQDDLLVGSPIANRDRAEIEDAIGFYTNTVVFRGDTSGGPSFQALLGRVKEATLGVLAHQEVPFEKVVEAVHPSRASAFNPVFQAMFAMQKAPESALSLRGVAAEICDVHSATAKFDVLLEMQEVAAGLQCSFEYSEDLFDPETAARMVSCFERLLAGIAREPKTSIDDFTLLEDTERQRILEDLNATALEFPEDACVHDLVAAQVARTPDAVAVRFEGLDLTYRELARRAYRLAHHLRTLGVGPDTMVGLYLERSLDLPVALLGILEAGGAYLPLDPAFPAERIGYMIEDAHAPVIVTQASLASSLPPHQAAVLRIDEDIPADTPTERPVGKTRPEHLSYVIYTSGSTGRPKGVELPHRGLVNLLTSIQREPGLVQGDRLLAVTTLSFDIGSLELLGPLTVGATCVLVPREKAADGALLAAELAREGITVMQATPASWRLLLDGGWTGTPGLKIITGGEALLPALATDLLERVGELWNLYGPTETTIYSTGSRITDPEDITIGRPVGNTRVYVLDARQRPVPVGVVGELWIGGVGLARGYHERPELTAERFLADPFGAKGARMYRTGDRARWRADGKVDYLGRADDQVKVRGFRIELGEIESVLAQHEAVKRAVVVVREAAPGDPRIVAFCVYHPGQEPAANELRRFLRQKLPDYMVPHIFLTLQAVPLTGSGKVDRRALPDPFAQQTVAASDFEPPQTPTEVALCGIWQDVLKRERVSRHDNFFDLGGHSLLSMQAIARIDKTLGHRLNPRSLVFQNVEQIAAEIDGAESPGKRSVMGKPRDHTVRLPASFAQQRLWFLEQVEPGTAVYAVPQAVRLRGPLDVAALQRALQAIVDRHETLRTTFAAPEGEPVQVVQPELTFTLPVVDLSGLKDAEEQAVRRANAEAQRPFDLAQGPLFRGELLRLGAQDHLLVLDMHHIICDGWSLSVLFREMSKLYCGHALLEPPFQYADYALFQRELVSSPNHEAELAFWRGRLGGELPVLELPTDRPRPAVQGIRGGQFCFQLSPHTTEQIAALGRRENTSAFTTLLAAFQVLMHRLSGQDDILVGSPVANRHRAEIEEAIGLYTNTAVFRSDLSGRPTFTALLGQVKARALEVLAHQEVPYEKVVEAVHPTRGAGFNPIFQVMFVLHKAHEFALDLPGVAVSPCPVHSATAKFDLLLEVQEIASGMQCFLEYSQDLFDDETAARMAGHFQTLLAGIVAAPDTSIDDLPLVSEAEQRFLLDGLNATAREYPRDACVHELVAAQARRTPDAIAIRFEGTDLTYRELMRRARLLAEQLRARGVGPDTLVGLYLERSLDLPVALLGILEAGGAYLPLDPAFPPERLGYMIEDARAPVIVTHTSLVDSLPPHQASVVRMDADLPTATPAAEPSEPARSETRPEHLAYVIYTSGSTGRPKGVEIPHRAVVNFLATMQDEPGFTASDRLLAVTTLSFDIAGLELLGPLTVGATCVLASRELAANGGDLAEALEREKITVMQATPATWRLLLEAGWSGAPGLKVLCGGEALPPSLAGPLLERVGELWNLYGPTETTIWSTCRRITDAGDVNIGRPIGNTRLYVLDPGLQPVPIGVVGDLWIGGEGLARGYHERPELTHERFLADPFAGPGARMYRTGDRARWRADGTVDYLGRGDDQVKVRGFRIELGEIETVLVQHDAIRQAVVVVREAAPGDARIVACCVYHLGHEPTASELRRFLRHQLPDYMIPHVFVQVSEIPLTANGKVNRNALPNPFAEDSVSVSEFVPPQTPTEVALGEIWSEVLKQERVSRYDNFFDLGGHSLLSMQAIARVDKILGHRLNPRSMVFQNIEQIAAEIDAAAAAVSESQPDPGLPGARTFLGVLRNRVFRS